MRRTPLWFVLVGGSLAVLAVLWQAFTISAYVRGAGDGALDAHGWGSLFVHIGQLLVVIGGIWAWWGKWNVVGAAIAFLVLSLAQLAFLGDTEKSGGWINGLHGFLALIVLISAALFAHAARKRLGPGQPEDRPAT
ncbi:MAG: hypothetical protein ACKVUT_08615 [Gaiella sp.]